MQELSDTPAYIALVSGAAAPSAPGLPSGGTLLTPPIGELIAPGRIQLCPAVAGRRLQIAVLLLLELCHQLHPLVAHRPGFSGW